MSELTEEQQKDLKLEEAKKKYEALKKKNKKKNKAKKETKTEDQDTAETEEQTPEVETAKEKEPTDEIVAAETDESPALDEGNAPEVAPLAVKEDIATQPTEEQSNKDTEETNQTEEDPVTELFGADDSSADPFGSIPAATPEATTDEAVVVAADEKTEEETPVVPEEKQEDTEEQQQQEENKAIASDIHAISPKQTSISPKTEPVGNLDQIQSKNHEIFPAESAKSATETTDLFGSTTDTQPSFLEVTSEEYKAQISELQTENQTLKNQIESLKTENKNLKFLKFDHLDQIETLQSQIEKLQSDLSKAKTDSSTNIQQNTHNGGNIDEDRVELSPTPTYQQPYFPQLTSRVSVSTSSFDQYRYGQKEAKLTSEEIKSRLSQWKGWNVDMTGWRSIGTGAVVDL
ncbi:hypothetical protein WICPIJ_004548 [Wickerhamomyces pijperi]|uniref:Uncharacterized protein n=1 Tax=Wickerhamomyces pijperi TaxID=599730 RepID=A0A9P8TLY3_WICPI|nr:hypothetical protein WICPIJ_004548 [Wickerhamomyces pijperi]